MIFRDRIKKELSVKKAEKEKEIQLEIEKLKS